MFRCWSSILAYIQIADNILEATQSRDNLLNNGTGLCDNTAIDPTGNKPGTFFISALVARRLRLPLNFAIMALYKQ